MAEMSDAALEALASDLLVEGALAEAEARGRFAGLMATVTEKLPEEEEDDERAEDG